MGSCDDYTCVAPRTKSLLGGLTPPWTTVTHRMHLTLFPSPPGKRVWTRHPYKENHLTLLLQRPILEFQ